MIQLQAEDVVKDVSTERMGRMFGGTTKAHDKPLLNSSRYHTHKSNGRAHNRSQASTNSFMPTSLLNVNAASSQKVIRDRGMAHERNLSLSQIEYGKRDYSPIITTSKHALRKIYDPKRKHVHSASVQTHQRRQNYVGGYQRSTKSDLHRQLQVKEKQLRLIKNQIQKQNRGRSGSSSNERPVKLRRKAKVSMRGDSVDVTQSQTVMGAHSRRSRIERGLDSTAQKILQREQSGLPSAGVVSVFGKRNSRNGAASGDRSQEAYDSRFGNKLESKYQTSPPTKLTASQLI